MSVAKSRIACAHLARISACRSRSVKCRHVRRAPVWTSDKLLVKISPNAAAISAAVGLVEGDSCQSLLRSGVMEIFSSGRASADAMRGRLRIFLVVLFKTAAPL